MTRVKRGFVARKRRKRILKLTKGFRGSHSVLYRTAQQRVLKSLSLSYRDRRQFKREVRKLWIRRINSGIRLISRVNLNKTNSSLPKNYSSFINVLKKSNIELNRKVLSQFAIFDPLSFQYILEKSH